MMNKKFITLALLFGAVTCLHAASYGQLIDQWINRNPNTALALAATSSTAAVFTAGYLAGKDKLFDNISLNTFVPQALQKFGSGFGTTCKQWVTDNPTTAFALGAAGLFAGSAFLSNYALKRAVTSGGTWDERANATKNALSKEFPTSEYEAIKTDPLRLLKAKTLLNNTWATAIQDPDSRSNLSYGDFDFYPNKTLETIAQTMERLDLNTLADGLQEKFITVITSQNLAPEYSADDDFSRACLLENNSVTQEDREYLRHTNAIYNLFKMYFIPGILQFINPGNPAVEPEKREQATQIFNNIYTVALQHRSSPHLHYTGNMDSVIKQFAKQYEISLDQSLINGLAQTANPLLFQRVLSALYNLLREASYSSDKTKFLDERAHAAQILDQAALDAEHAPHADRASMLHKLALTIGAYERKDFNKLSNISDKLISEAINQALNAPGLPNYFIDMIQQSYFAHRIKPKIPLELCKFINIVYAPDFPPFLKQLFNDLQDDLQTAFDDSVQDRYDNAFNRVRKTLNMLRYADTHQEEATNLYNQFRTLIDNQNIGTVHETAEHLKRKLGAITTKDELNLFQLIAHITLGQHTSRYSDNRQIISGLTRAIASASLAPHHAASSSQGGR